MSSALPILLLVGAGCGIAYYIYTKNPIIAPVMGLHAPTPYRGDLPAGHDWKDLKMDFDRNSSFSTYDGDGHKWDYSNGTWAMQPTGNAAAPGEWKIGPAKPYNRYQEGFKTVNKRPIEH